MGVTSHFVIFRDRPVVYGRVPKVANSSIKAALIRLLSQRPEKGTRTQSDAFWRKLTNDETQMLSTAKTWALRDSKFIFSFVRNPLDRLVSSYNNKILSNEAPPRRMLEAGYKTNMEFDDFVRLTADLPDDELDVHIMPQSEMLVHKGRVVPHFVGHFENIIAEWEKLQDILAAKQIVLPALPAKNVRRADRDDIRSYFKNDAITSLALKKYEKDAAVFYPGVSPDQLLSGEFELPEINRPA
jgi:dermatan 4-sulfotransferase 1